ncbi:zinc finger protein 862 isoform X2 [Bombina bombina]|nr:zinc finger protein 862 isoform X2 [Bombina bombina]
MESIIVTEIEDDVKEEEFPVDISRDTGQMKLEVGSSEEAMQMILTRWFAVEPSVGGGAMNQYSQSASDFAQSIKLVQASPSMTQMQETSKVFREAYTTAGQTQTPGRRKFKEEWCRELRWLKYDKTTGFVNCKVCVSFPNLADPNSKLVKGFTGPFKLETFKKHGKSRHHLLASAKARAETVAIEEELQSSCVFGPSNVLVEVSPSTGEMQERERALEESPNSPCQSQIPGGRKFRKEWCRELSWLKYDQASGIASCKICANFPNLANQNSKLVKGCTGPFRLETFKIHGSSRSHLTASSLTGAEAFATNEELQSQSDSAPSRVLEEGFSLSSQMQDPRSYLEEASPFRSQIQELRKVLEEASISQGQIQELRRVLEEDSSTNKVEEQSRLLQDATPSTSLMEVPRRVHEEQIGVPEEDFFLTNQQEEPKRVLEEASSTSNIQPGRRKFRESWCHELKWLKYDRSSNTASCEICHSSPSTVDQNNMTVKCFAQPFKLEKFKKHARSRNHLLASSREGVHFALTETPQSESDFAVRVILNEIFSSANLVQDPINVLKQLSLSTDQIKEPISVLEEASSLKNHVEGLKSVLDCLPSSNQMEGPRSVVDRVFPWTSQMEGTRRIIDGVTPWASQMEGTRRIIDGVTPWASQMEGTRRIIDGVTPWASQMEGTRSVVDGVSPCTSQMEGTRSVVDWVSPCTSQMEESGSLSEEASSSTNMVGVLRIVEGEGSTLKLEMREPRGKPGEASPSKIQTKARSFPEEASISINQMSDPKRVPEDAFALTSQLALTPTIILQSRIQSPGRRKFKEEWCRELTWLKYDKMSGVAVCEICASVPNDANQNSKAVKAFTEPFRLATFKKHGKSHYHLNCAREKNILLPPQLALYVKTMDEDMTSQFKTLFNVAYYIAKNNKPFTDFDGLLELSGKLGATLKEGYANDKRCKDFISSIAKVIRNEVTCELKRAVYVSLILDRSTDKVGVEELVLYVRYIKNNGIKEAFLSVLPLNSASTDDHLDAITKELQLRGLSEWLTSSQLIGIATDGAESMLEDENGLVQKLKQNLHHIIHVCCVSARLNIILRSSVQNSKSIEDLDSVLKKIYSFYQCSPKRMRQLKQVATSLQHKIQKFQYLRSLRWVVGKVDGLSALANDWKCVVVHLESVVVVDDGASSVASDLLKKMTNFKFVQMLHFLLDYLGIIKNLSLLFQREGLFLSSVQLHIKNTIASLQSLKDTPGEHEEKLISKTSTSGQYQDVQLVGLSNTAHTFIQSEKEKLIQSAVQNFEEQFLNQTEVEKCISVFDTAAWPTENSLAEYGVSEITTLAQHFQKQISPLDMHEKCLTALRNEWKEFKDLGKGKKPSELLDFARSNIERFPNLGNLLSIVSVLPVSTVCCEKGISLINLVKSKLRASMQDESLSDLLTINMNGPPIKDFDPSKSVNQWYFNARRHVHGHKRSKC